mgnify:CR=1 FL=1
MTTTERIEQDGAIARGIEQKQKQKHDEKKWISRTTTTTTSAMAMAMEEQLKETRKEMAERWKDGKGGTMKRKFTETASGCADDGDGDVGVDGAAGSRSEGFYDQIKHSRERLAEKWKSKSTTTTTKNKKTKTKTMVEKEMKRIHTIKDLEEIERGDRSSKAASASTSTTAPSSSENIIGKRAFDLTNEFRAKQGHSILKWNQRIAEIGREQSKNMAEGRVPFGHEGFATRATRMPTGTRTTAENVAMTSGFSDPAKMAVEGWIKSPGHRKNMLSHFDFSGIGVFTLNGKTFLTQLFST